MGTLAKVEDPDEMHHNAAFHQGLHSLLIFEEHSGAVIHHNLDNSTCDPLKCTMGSPILNVSICMEKSIRIQRVNKYNSACCLNKVAMYESDNLRYVVQEICSRHHFCICDLLTSHYDLDLEVRCLKSLLCMLSRCGRHVCELF